MINGGLKLGQLLEQLRKHDAVRDIAFDFCGLAPAGLHSYRGFYEDLALDYDSDIYPTVGAVATELEEAIGKTFTGYKGGEYRMGEDSTLWVSEHNRCDGTIITGVEDNEHDPLIILTGYEAC